VSTVIRVEGLSKKYIIGHRSDGGYSTFRETMARSVRNTGKRLLSPFRSSSDQPLATLDNTEEFWSLRDVSFEVKQGERVGIIGRNGAGKTTLLKILSRITEPTKGKVSINGKVASLLEVGTGFHPELTGRENIFLNGAVLGMGKDEIKRRFDEIVAFAEVERFLDTPVKRYSSGMYVRLAFAVAAHLEPEILLVDEVLAVGDLAFQKKCLGKMEDVSRQGRTVLFVSHNMGAITEFCSKAILIRAGSIAKTGSCKDVIPVYLELDSSVQRVDFSAGLSRVEAGEKSRISFVELRNEDGGLEVGFGHGETITVGIGISGKIGEEINLGVGVRDSYARQILHFNNRDDGQKLCLAEEVTFFVLSFVNTLNEGEYYLTVWLGDSLMASKDYVRDCLRFSVDVSSLGRSLAKGMVIYPGNWTSTSTGSKKNEHDR